MKSCRTRSQTGASSRSGSVNFPGANWVSDEVNSKKLRPDGYRATCAGAWACGRRSVVRGRCGDFGPSWPGIRQGGWALTIFDAVLCVVDRSWSSQGSRPQKSIFVLRHWSPLQHERLSQARILRTLRRAPVPLRLARNKSLFPISSALSPPYSLSLVSSRRSFAALYRTTLATFNTVVSSHSISIGPASAATTGGFLLTA